VSADYFTEIESHFAQRRGTPFIVNTKDWALMKEWHAEGIPLSVVIEAIDAVFDRFDATQRKVNGLSFCKFAVKELWRERKDLQIGAENAAPEENVEPLLEALASRLAANEVAAPFAPRVRELARERSVPRIEECLMELEQELIDSLLPRAEALRAEARALTSGADEKTRTRTEQAHLRRLIREKYGLPRLTLFEL
jgi:hypothetical protein